MCCKKQRRRSASTYNVITDTESGANNLHAPACFRNHVRQAKPIGSKSTAWWLDEYRHVVLEELTQKVAQNRNWLRNWLHQSISWRKTAIRTKGAQGQWMSEHLSAVASRYQHCQQDWITFFQNSYRVQYKDRWQIVQEDNALHAVLLKLQR